jgi:quinol monooxygenase YgiN
LNLAIVNGEAEMIDMVVTQLVSPGKEQEFEALARELEANTLAYDKGCLRYEWYRAASPSTYTLIERWADEATVQAHLRAGHFEAVLPKLRACVPERFSVIPLRRFG